MSEGSGSMVLLTLSLNCWVGGFEGCRLEVEHMTEQTFGSGRAGALRFKAVLRLSLESHVIV